MFAIVHAHAVPSSAATPLALSPGSALVPAGRFRYTSQPVGTGANSRFVECVQEA